MNCIPRRILPAFLLFVAVLIVVSPAHGQDNMSVSPRPAITVLDSTKEQDGLVGSVRRVKTETARIELKDGRPVEGPTQLVEVTTYGIKGNRIENTSYPIGGGHAGKEEYKYDDRGNITEIPRQSRPPTIPHGSSGDARRGMGPPPDPGIRTEVEVTRLTRCAALGLLLAMGLAPAAGHAQESASAPADQAGKLEEIHGQLEGMTEQLQTLQADTDKLRKFKFSGYVQARWETAENKNDSVRVTGTPPVVTPANTERFFIRRGRLKMTYDSSPLSQAVVYFDGGADRTIRLLEAYVTLLDPWTPLHSHGLTVGQMNVPFGYELERSSSARELPERSRAESVLFPGERDRGVKLVSQWTSQLETVVGVLNGAGISSADYPTSDPTPDKDLLARVRFAQGVVDAAVSWYSGHAVTGLTGPDVETDKLRYGADVQGYYELPLLGGGSLRAEAYAGTELNPDSLKALTTVPSGGGRLLRAGADPAGASPRLPARRRGHR